MRCLVELAFVFALGLMPLLGCGESEGAGGGGGSAGTGGVGGIAPERAFASDDFRRIELRHSETGVCEDLEEEMVIGVTIVRGAQGAASIEGTRLIEAGGWVEEPFGPSPLSTDDVASLQALIAEVPPPPDLSGLGAFGGAYCAEGTGGCDVCLHATLSIDGDSATWSTCCGPGNYTESFLALVASIEELVVPQNVVRREM